MKLHTSLPESAVRAALASAKAAGQVADNVTIDTLVARGSRSHAGGFDLHLSSPVKDRNADGKVRRPCNSGQYGAGDSYAASWAEWGHFMSRVFDADPNAQFGSVYRGRSDFHNKTRGQFDNGAQPRTPEAPARVRQPASRSASPAARAPQEWFDDFWPARGVRDPRMDPTGAGPINRVSR